MTELGKFYITATPIGNLEDITFRAIRTLKEVDIIFAEDTRVTKKLLNHYKIKNKIQSYHAHSDSRKEDEIISLLREGKSCALVSDAGMPCISDPGSRLIKKVYEEFGNDAEVITIPGPSALISALSISGISVNQFTFFGFIPHKKGRDKFFNEINESKKIAIFYESSHRILKTLEKLSEKLPKDRKVIIARELTKIYEEVFRGNPKEVFEYYKNNTDKVKGEFVVIVDKL